LSRRPATPEERASFARMHNVPESELGELVVDHGAALALMRRVAGLEPYPQPGCVCVDVWSAIHGAVCTYGWDHGAPNACS
jgi:hypothetical protein